MALRKVPLSIRHIEPQHHRSNGHSMCGLHVGDLSEEHGEGEEDVPLNPSPTPRVSRSELYEDSEPLVMFTRPVGAEDAGVSIATSGSMSHTPQAGSVDATCRQ